MACQIKRRPLGQDQETRLRSLQDTSPDSCPRACPSYLTLEVRQNLLLEIRKRELESHPVHSTRMD